MLRLRKILLCDILYYALLLITIIFLIFYLNLYKRNSKYNESDDYFVLRIKKFKIDGDKLTIEFDNLIGYYYFKSLEEKESFYKNYSLNDILSINGSLSIPNNNTIPNTFNYKKYLSHKKIDYILKIDNYSIKEKNKNILFKIKNYIYKRINNISNNSYLYAFILGESSYIDEEIYNNYKINNITHLFALSGLHISIFSSILLFILNKLKCNQVLSFILVSIFLLFFSFIASFTPSILRATILFILSNINNIFYFYIKPKYLLFITFIILTLINPYFIFYTGFILSFTITYFILLNNENNNKSSILKISIISFLSSFPIIINLSYEINILGFLNNLFFIPYVSSIVFPLSLLTVTFDKLIVVLNIFLRLMEFISLLSSKILNITLLFSKISYIEIIIYYILLILVIKRIKVSKLFLIVLIIFLYLKPYLFKNDYIYYLDVKQGDSSLIIINNTSILIDSGGIVSNETEEWKNKNKKYNQMINSVIPFFKSIGLKKIDYVIITHGDFDHMGEAINLVNNFKVEKVVFNCGPYNDLEKELIKVLNKKKIKYYSCIKELNIDKNKLYFLQTKEYDNENDNSNVIYTELNGYKFMFMGDASVTTEKEILDKYDLSDVDVLKVGHHGSKTSSSREFINEVNPNYSIISVGKKNRYGHPNKEVLETLKDTKIYRTDIDGSIMFKIKNNMLKIETCSP